MASSTCPYNIFTVNAHQMRTALKAVAFNDFLRDNHCDIAFVQEITRAALDYITDFTVLANVDPTMETGTAILTRPGTVLTDVTLLPSGRAIMGTIGDVTFINVYAPSGDIPAQRMFYGHQLVELLGRSTNKIIMGGDFNAVLSAADQIPRPNISPELDALVGALRLQDTWRVLHPRETQFTFFYPTGRSRLDRIYASSTLQGNIRQVQVLPVFFSDHCSYRCQILLPCQPSPRRRTIWKLNCSLLSDANLAEGFMDLWNALLLKRQHATSTLDWWVSVVKPAIRSYLILYSKEKAYWRKAHNEFNQQCLQDLVNIVTQDPRQLPLLKRFKAKLLSDMRARGAGMVVRSQPHGEVPNEPASIYHLQRERKRRETLHIGDWVTQAGQRTKDQRVIQADIYDYFEHLFQDLPVDETTLDDVLQHVPSILTPAQRDGLIADFTRDDVEEALKHSPQRRSPGLDGIPTEFYRQFSNILTDVLVDIANDLLHGVAIPPDFTVGSITLVPKSKAIPSVANIRPITLLNVDYKIVARCIVGRMKSVLSSILSPQQHCAVRTRNIYDAVLAYRDCIGHVRADRTKRAAMLLIDFKNAFDRVSHAYLQRVMTTLGFGPIFTGLIQSLLGTATSRVNINGFLSRPLRIRRSVRQGCPLSMALFAIALDPLLRTIDHTCSGIQLGANRLTSCAYADDLGVFLRTPNEVDLLHGALQRFERATGAIINPQKTVLLPLARWPKNVRRDWFTEQDKHKVLGIILTNNPQRMAALNWKPTLHSIRALCHLHSVRTLALHDRVKIINEVILAKAWYLAQVLPVPKEIERGIKFAAYSMLWRGNLFKASMDTCTLAPEAGGLGLVDFHAKCAALLIRRTTVVISQHPDSPTATLFSRFRPPLPQTQAQIMKIPYYLNHVRLYFLHSSSIRDGDLRRKRVKELTQDLRGSPAPNKWELRLPDRDWTTIWRNISSKILPTPIRATWYQVVNRTVPTNAKRHAIRLRTTADCATCRTVDTLEHRFTCRNHVAIWNVARDMLRLINRVSLNTITVDDAITPDWTPFPNTKKHAMQWIMGRTIHSIFTLAMTDPIEFLSYLWTEHENDKKQTKYKEKFGKFLKVSLEFGFAKQGIG